MDAQLTLPRRTPVSAGDRRGPRRGVRAVGLPLLGVLAAAVACSDATAPTDALLVASGFTDQVLLLSPEDGRTLEVRETDPRPGERDEPHAVAVAPDGRHWYATLSHGEPTLWKFESDGDRLVGRVDLGTASAGRIGISPDSRFAVVGDYGLAAGGAPGEVVLVRLEDLVVTVRATVCAAPHDAAWSPDGTRVAITCPLSDEVLLLDGATLEVVHRTPIPDPDGLVGEPGNPHTRPMNLAWSPDGARIFVTLMRTGEVAVMRADGSGEARVRVGGGPTQIAVTPDGRSLVVPLRADFAVAILDANTFERRALVATPDLPHPHGITLSPDGSTAFVAHEGTVTSAGGVSAIDVVGDSLLWSRGAGSFNLGIAYRAAPVASSSR